MDIIAQNNGDVNTLLHNILNVAQKAKQTSPTQWQCQCPNPAHKDNNPSCGFGMGDKGVVAKCLGCGAGFVELLDFWGIQRSKKIHYHKKYDIYYDEYRENVARYDYHDKDGKLLYWKIRNEYYLDGARQKKVTPFRSYDKNGVIQCKRGCSAIPYNLPAVLKSNRICFCEGEKAADSINQRGLTATTLDTGGNSGFQMHNVNYFKGKKVYIFPDNDETGVKFIDKVGQALKGVAEKIYVVALPNLPHKGDVYDYFQVGGKVENLFDNTTEYETQAADTIKTDITPKVKWFTDVVPKQRNWLWYPFLRQGKINLINATQGTGKSTFNCWIAARLSRGEFDKLPLHDRWAAYNAFDRTPRTTLILNAEDSPDEDTAERLIKCGADMSKIAYVETKDLNINLYSADIENWIIETKASLVIFDPIQQFFSGVDPHGNPMSMNDAQSVRPALTHLTALAEKYNVTVIIVTHPNKDRTKNALHSIMGSNDFSAQPRSALQIGYDPDCEMHGDNSRILSHLKSNSVPDCDKISLRLHFDYDNGVVVFDGESGLKADEVKDGQRKEKTAKEVNPIDEWLENIFNENDRILLSEVKRRAENKGFSWVTVQKRKQRVGWIKHSTSKKEPVEWYVG